MKQLVDRFKNPAFLFWGSSFLLSLVLASNAKGWAKALDAGWMMKYPRAWYLPLKNVISQAMAWLVEDATFGLFTFKEFTRAIAWLLHLPLEFATSLLSSGFVQSVEGGPLLPALSWIAVIAVVVALGHYARNWALAILVGGCFAYLVLFGQWESSMVTLSSIIISVPFGVASGVLLGTMAYRWPWVERFLSPVLDLMQTVPVFAYLVPILFLFGFGPVSAMIATIIYAAPPMVRVTVLALRAVPHEIRDFGLMAGCTRRQMMWKVLIPSAAPSLMVGVNQVIMLSLNMVIIASMIGAGGLGFDVLASLRRLDIGGGLEAGLAIVVLAIALDRLSYALALHQRSSASDVEPSLWKRYPHSLICLVVIVAAVLLALVSEFVRHFPEVWQLTMAGFWETLVEYINVHFFTELEAFKTFMLIHFLVPVKRFLLGLPWPWVCLMVVIAGYRLGGIRLALLVGGLCLFVLMTGQWTKAMITVYLCGVSVILAGLIGIPLGIFAAENERASKVVLAAIDTLQTLPSFVYLIPVVMLFRVGDFSAMIAVVLYALAPAVRYTMHGIQMIEPSLIEAGTVSGCTRRQLLWKVKLPLAVPEIMLGINQTIMLALSMLVITALVGTRDLGQEVYIALTKADTGRGVVAGLSIAFIAIVADRLISAGAKNAKRRLGLA